MFDDKIKLLKNKYELLCEEFKVISDEYNKNLNAQIRVKQLKNSRNAFIYCKKHLFLFPILCLMTIGAIYFGFSILCFNPNIYFIAMLLLSGGSASFLVTAYLIIEYFIDKNDYKKNATNENLELENNIEEIINNEKLLMDKLRTIKENKDMYEKLINYFNEYNSNVSLLNSLMKEEKNNLEDVFNEYLEERVDYSKVHLTECVLPEKVKIRGLTNIIK